MSEPNPTPQTPGDNPTVDQAKLQGIADSTVDVIADELDGLSKDELEQLLVLERAGKGRTTAMDRIQRELESRESGADNEPEHIDYNRAGDAHSYANKHAREVDPTKLAAPVLTLDGWVCPAPKAEPQA